MSMRQSTEKTEHWLRVFTACGPLLPSLISWFFPSLTIPHFTPRQFIYENDLLPFLFAIWAKPTSFSGHLSRIIQAKFLWLLPASTFRYYQLWIFTATLRTAVGHLLTRSVGWAYPQFFGHWALYEICGGYGPSIVIYIFLFGGPDIIKALFKRLLKAGELILLVSFCAVLCWLDNAPWTYGVAVLGAGGVSLVNWALRMVRNRPKQHPMLPDGQLQNCPPKFRTILVCAVLALLALSFPYAIQNRMATFIPTDMPPAPSAGSPLLEVLILSFPRPNVSASTAIMTSTINSFIPHLSSDVVLSVFTHSISHKAFDNVRTVFASTNVTFYVDTDSHPDSVSGQYLHIAEAFRWSTEQSVKAEWVMLVEDDFPICGGERGWDAVRRVMQILESTRSPSTKALNRQGGFVGTGGSGLIFHRTMLPVLILLMRTHAETASRLSPTTVRRPADLVMQDCLLGADPLCPQKPEGGGLVITSRMVMDHIGGMATTNQNKAFNDDKWRCGWRHPFHGRRQVEVVVV
ncbi:hypothetical protein D9615_003508 [Tricholomella constricta]|uniref:Uncharacterized protein n=1 Tax=Tricholomella constricta TaxID=117010 RepID=A0A8H5HI63_9AGAR|nr:hypothetical protein D9615_003508 [Tricholomella constricta]